MTTSNLLTIKKGREHHVRNEAELMESNDMTTGQCFHAVALYYGKTRDDYPRWISYRKHQGEWRVMDGFVQECKNDLEKVHLVCQWLEEEPFK